MNTSKQETFHAYSDSSLDHRASSSIKDDVSFYSDNAENDQQQHAIVKREMYTSPPPFTSPITYTQGEQSPRNDGLSYTFLMGPALESSGKVTPHLGWFDREDLREEMKKPNMAVVKGDSSIQAGKRKRKSHEGENILPKRPHSSKQQADAVNYDEAELLNGNFIIDSNVAESYGDQIVFDETSNRGDAFHGIMAGLNQEEKAQAKRDLATLNSAIQNLNIARSNYESADRGTKRHLARNVKPSSDAKWSLKGMASSLAPHQVCAAGWMAGREIGAEEPHGGILADQMGLGKTVSALSLIMNRLPLPGAGPRATLIVVPSSTFAQWHSEIIKHCVQLDPEMGPAKDFGLMILRSYRGSKNGLSNNPKWDLLNSDIVLTTYWEIVYSIPPPSKVSKKVQEPHQRKQLATKKSNQSQRDHQVLHQVKWLRVILDEAHLIKNPHSRTSLACRALDAKHYWALTGTPIMNGAVEFYALFDFIKHPNVGCDVPADVKRIFPTVDEVDTEELKVPLSKVMLLRKHGSKFMGRRLVSLPPISHERVEVKFCRLEAMIYRLMADEYAKIINEASASGTLDKQRPLVIQLYLQLRQLVAHPITIQYAIFDALRHLDAEKLQDFIDPGRHKKKLDKELALQLRKMYTKCEREVKFPASKPASDGLDNLRGDEDDPAPRPGNLHACSVCSACPAVEAVITDCNHIYCTECLHKSASDDAAFGLDNSICKVCSTAYTQATPFIPPKKHHHRTSLAGTADDWTSPTGDLWASAKLRLVLKTIQSWKRADPSVKTIIFTQWRPLIDTLSRLCTARGWGVCRFTGSMAIGAKTSALDHFASNASKTILLCSLHSGALGLNLTAASRAINLDPWWNAAVEQQAFARVYRIGQSREVKALSVVVEGTVDGRMGERTEEKQGGIEGVMSEYRRLKELTVREVMGLFGEVGRGEQGRDVVVAVPGNGDGDEAQVDEDDEDEDEGRAGEDDSADDHGHEA